MCTVLENEAERNRPGMSDILVGVAAIPRMAELGVRREDRSAGFGNTLSLSRGSRESVSWRSRARHARIRSKSLSLSRDTSQKPRPLSRLRRALQISTQVFPNFNGTILPNTGQVPGNVRRAQPALRRRPRPVENSVGVLRPRGVWRSTRSSRALSATLPHSPQSERGTGNETSRYESRTLFTRLSIRPLKFR